MGSQLQELLLGLPGLSCGLTGIAVTIVILIRLSRRSYLDAIPTFGSSSYLGSWWAGFKFLSNGVDIIREGYIKHKSAPFKFATLRNWTVIFCSHEHVEELRKAPDDTLSFADAINDHLQIDYTMGPEIHYNPYHVTVVRSQLTRNIGLLYPEIRNEVITAFDDVLDLNGDKWKSIPVLSSVEHVVCRTTNRVFVGLPLCRDPEWIDLNIRYTIDVSKGAAIIALFPNLLKPIATWLFTSINQRRQRARELLYPVIEERRKHLNGNKWADKPDDFLSWLMEAEGPEMTIQSLTTRIITVNVAAIHTSSFSFTHALFHLAANPQYIQPLREEVECIVEKMGWSKDALSEMRKVDSFLRECQRIEGMGTMSVARKALKDFTFSDGTFIPKGTMIGIASDCIHHDEKFYKNANVFEPFRFAEMQEEDGEGSKYQFVSTGTVYLPFGHGKHACPGRFFAATELKTMLAHVVTTYDIKLEDGATHPPNLQFGGAIVPNPHAKVMFRRRAEAQ